MELIQYSGELAAVTIVTLFAVVSPGADFAITIRNSLIHSRRSGILSSIGIGCGVWVHVFYSILGIGLLLSKSLTLFTVIKVLGALYLFYLGFKTFREKQEFKFGSSDTQSTTTMGDFKAFRIGFITNALNPKTSLFFLSIFTQVIDQNTPVYMQLIYGFIISAAHIIWFSFVASVLTSKIAQAHFEKISKYFNKIFGTILMGLGIRLAFAAKDV